MRHQHSDHPEADRQSSSPSAILLGLEDIEHLAQVLSAAASALIGARAAIYDLQAQHKATPQNDLDLIRWGGDGGRNLD